MKSKRIIGVLLSAALVAAACGGSDDGGTAAPAPGGETTAPAAPAPTERVIRIATSELESPNLAPEHAYDLARSVELGNIFEGLLDRDPATGGLRGVLATSWTQVDDTTFTFKLREGVKFHDGTEFTADEAVASLNHLLRPDSRIVQVGSTAGTVRTIGDLEIEISIQGPTPLFLDRLTMAKLMPSFQVEDEDSYTTTPIGTGPYSLQDYRVGDSWVLVKNPDWWGLTADDAYGQANWDRAEFTVRPERATRAAALLAGEVDFAFDIGGGGCSSLGEDCVVLGRGGEIIDIRYDATSSIMSDARVRRALDLAMDREGIAEAVYGPGVDAAGQAALPGFIGYDPTATAWPFDPTEAKRLLDEAVADGVVIDAPIVLLGQTGRFERMEEVFQAIAFQWESTLGIETEIQIIEAAQYGPQYRRGSEPPNHLTVSPTRHNVIITTGHGFSVFDVQTYADSRWDCGGNLNSYCDEDFTERFVAASLLTGEARDAALRVLNREQYEANAWSALLHYPRYHGVADTVQFTPRFDGWLLLADFAPAS